MERPVAIAGTWRGALARNRAACPQLAGVRG
jgi:hypothetical protein